MSVSLQVSEQLDSYNRRYLTPIISNPDILIHDLQYDVVKQCYKYLRTYTLHVVQNHLDHTGHNLYIYSISKGQTYM